MTSDQAPRPYTLIAELTYRCPLSCAYCSNPLELALHDAELTTADWSRVFAEAAALGVLQVNLTGGEPLVRPDLEALVAAARKSDLYVNLITSGIPADADRLARLAAAGLDSLQLSVQDTDPHGASWIAGRDDVQAKMKTAAATRALGLPLTLNVVLHRGNIARVAASSYRWPSGSALPASSWPTRSISAGRWPTGRRCCRARRRRRGARRRARRA